ncbi:ALF repeat-containing protein [Streptomyces sp. NPDC051994]|uniref:ALF repeat-containing protein n=1 Tax=unclassified Streptomyces TaxID=2593676 RepID=UPI00342116E7
MGGVRAAARSWRESRRSPGSPAARSAAAARTARDAANSAADHAEKAAAAARWAAQYAGQALDYAKKSTDFANEATKAANTATDAVAQAIEVEKSARQAEWQRLDGQTKQAVEECRLLSQLADQERAERADQRTQAEQHGQVVKDLIAAAEQALKAGDTSQATVLGRQAAIGLLDARGGWSRSAARFALCGADADIHAWIDTDRQLAQQQDDRETVLFLAQISSPAIADAATAALQSNNPDAVVQFLTSGAVNAAATDNSVTISSILATNPGNAVKKAANAELDAGTPQALYDFLSSTFEKARLEDDSVAVSTLLANAGPYTKAHAQAAMEGPAWMRRNLLAGTQYQTAQLDHDSAGHIAAIQASIAAAAKIAHKAQESAARARQAAANARNAAKEAQDWATKAAQSLAKANEYAQQANANADAAEKSAKDAQASADTAKQAAAKASIAARSANYSANRAVDAARSATASANAAQNSAVSARVSAAQAGQDAKGAAAAASQAQQIAATKRQAETAAAAAKAAADARQAKTGVPKMRFDVSLTRTAALRCCHSFSWTVRHSYSASLCLPCVRGCVRHPCLLFRDGKVDSVTQDRRVFVRRLRGVLPRNDHCRTVAL